jgi:XTP/dITP diphosphohydrolase
MEIVVATGNKGKLKEIKAGIALYAPELTCVSMTELASIYGEPPDVAETENTYIGNATLKAEAIFEWAKGERIILSDDAGIEVDALDGKPGVFTARYRSPSNASLVSVDAVIHDIEGVTNRKAKMISVIVIKFPDGNVVSSRAELPGRLTTVRSESAEGFGFDPWFITDGETVTNADIKKERGATFLTHRLKALKDVLLKIGVR